MWEIQKILTLDPNIRSALLSVWESAVARTHAFLSSGEITAIKPDVEQGLTSIEALYGCYENQNILGFIGVENQKIEMLFIDAAARGKGIGKGLLEYAVHHLGARFVDVNEQNAQGVGFYLHMGFEQIGRSPLDGQGRPFPLLHLELKQSGRDKEGCGQDQTCGIG